jgi:LacI family transcriptional regulator
VAVDLLGEASLELSGGHVHFGAWSEAWGRRAARVVLRAAPVTDAFFCGNDQIARGVTDALRESGRRVPDDVAVVGYDNWDTMALASRPPLTTVDMNLHDVGRRSALRLLDAIDGRPTAGVEWTPCRLVLRDSA